MASLRVCRPASRNRIAVDVAKLFDEFAVCEDVEIVVAALPELRATSFESLRRFMFQRVESDGPRMELGFRVVLVPLEIGWHDGKIVPGGWELRL